MKSLHAASFPGRGLERSAKLSNAGTLRKPRHGLIVFAGVTWTALTLSWTATAGTKTWDGGGANVNWTTAANWSSNVAPVAGDLLVFPAGRTSAVMSNNFSAGTVFSGFLFSGTYKVRGNLVNLTNGVAANRSGNGTLDLDLQLSRPVTFDCASPTADLSFTRTLTLNGLNATFDGIGGHQRLDGLITDTPGAASRVIISGRETAGEGATVVVLNGTNNCPGATVVTNISELVVNGVSTSRVAVASSARLSGTGVIGNVTTSGTIAPGGENPGRLTVTGAFTFGALAKFIVRIAGTTPGVTHDQLQCGNSVTLLGTPDLFIERDPGFVPEINDRFVVLNKTSAGSIGGTFGGLPNGALMNVDGVTYQISYVGGDGNDLTLIVTAIEPQLVTRVWDGSVSTGWNRAANWRGDIAPVALNHLEFPRLANRANCVNDFPLDTRFNSIRFRDVTSAENYPLLGGIRIQLLSGIWAGEMGSGSVALALPIILDGSQTFSNGSPNTAIELRGDLVVAPNTLTVRGPGVFRATGSIAASPSANLVQIDGGHLVVNGALSGNVLVTGNGELSGRGDLGAVTVSAGALTPGDGGRAFLMLNGGLTLSSAATVNMEFVAPTPGTGHDQIVVNSGNVSLGSATLNLTTSRTKPEDETFVLIVKASPGPINGTFVGMPEGAELIFNGISHFISYTGGDGNDVVLTSRNRPPVFTPVPDATIFEQVRFTTTVHASGPEPGDSVSSYSIDPSSPEGVTVTRDGVLEWWPSEEQGPGTHAITVIATDNGNPKRSTSMTFQVTVLDTNLPPAAGVLPETAFARDELTPISIEVRGYDPDSPPASLTYELLEPYPDGMTFATSSEGAFINWTPTEEQGPVGYRLIVRITEAGAGGLSTDVVIPVLVREVNVPPRAVPVPDTNVLAGETLTMQLTAIDPDIPANHLTWSFDSPNPGAMLSSEGQFSFTPPVGSGGTWTFTANVNDGGAVSHRVTFNVRVGVRRTVTNTSDSGPGSLRKAMLDVNANIVGGKIEFNIPGAGPHKIAPSTPLPVLVHPTIIDGYTQPEARANTLGDGDDAIVKIELSGENLPGATGLTWNASEVTVRGLCVNRWGAAIAAGAGTGNTNAVIEGCFVGTDPGGTIAQPNTNGIVLSRSFRGRVGGPGPAQRNLIAGNAQAGILLRATNPDDFLHNLTIQGNFIGTGRSGNSPLGNRTLGILAEAGSATTNSVVADNVISDNLQGGIRLAGNRNFVMRNKIGLGADGVTALGNGGPGVLVAEGTGHSVLGNSISQNLGLAIDLGTPGLDLNDPDDRDTGPNDLQNKPILTSVTDSGPVLVSGALHSGPNTTYRIEFFHSPDFAPANQPQARTFIGSLEVTTDEAGRANFTAPVTLASNDGLITATATDAAGSTSEISKGLGVGGTSVPSPFAPPLLRIVPAPNNSIVLSWTPTPVNVDPTVFPDFQLQMSDDLVNWADFGPVVRGGTGVNLLEQTVSVPAVGPAGFFRLAISANLSDANLADQDLRRAAFRGANLAEANLTGAILIDADLRDADLRGADLTGANLEGALLDGANLSGAKLDDYVGEFVLHAVSAPANEPVSLSIPNLGFNARDGDYSSANPALPDHLTSHNTLMVVFKQGTMVTEANNVLEAFGARIAGGLKGNIADGPGLLFVRVPTANHQELAPLLTALKNEPRIELVIQDALRDIAMVPLDYSPGEAAPSWTWDLQRGVNGNWGYKTARVPQMWNLNSGVKKAKNDAVITGIVDAGFCQYHADVPFIEGVPPMADFHGTFVASVIGATFDNKSGMEGVNPFAKMLPTTGHASKKVSEAEIIDRLRTLTAKRARVINMSLGLTEQNDPATGAIVPFSAAQLESIRTSSPTPDSDGDAFAKAMKSLTPPPDGQVPLVVVAAGNSAQMDAALSLGAANAGRRGLVNNVLVVEALQVVNATVGLSCYSDVNGDVSAPADGVTAAATGPGALPPPAPRPLFCGVGRDGSPCGAFGVTDFGGTSIAAPFVTGLAGYCFAVDPTLTAPEVATLIKRNALAVGPGVAPSVDAWATVLDIDRLKNNERVLRMLVDIDDGTPDGNQRLTSVGGFNNVDFKEEDADGDDGPGDGQIDMSDFRRWRDWLLEAENAPALELDGSPEHPKKDLNGDGVVKLRAPGGLPDGRAENVFPRGDFNGDGIISRNNPFPMPGFFGRAMMTDFQVLKNLFHDPDYTADELETLIDSCDYHIDARLMFENPKVHTVFASVSRTGDSQTLRDHIHSAAKPDFIYTVPISGVGHTVRVVALDSSGNILCQQTTNFPFLGPGADRYLEGAAEPACVDVVIGPSPASVVVGHALQFDASVTGTRDMRVTWAATGGTIDNNGQFTAGNTTGDFLVTATSVADPAQSNIVTITIYECALDISPSQTSMRAGDQLRFITTVTGNTISPVRWSGGGGTMDATGLYTAGNTEGTFTVRAESDGCRPGTATVKISRCTIVNRSCCENDGRAGGQDSVQLEVDSACGGRESPFRFPYRVVESSNHPVLQFCCGGITYVNTSPESTPPGSYTASLTVENVQRPQERLTLTYVFTMNADRISSISPDCTQCQPFAPAEMPAGVSSSIYLSNGHPQLEILAAPGHPYLIEASTNLTDWIVIGTQIADRQGKVSFTDRDGRFASRFYRVVAP